jgi:hypothetical protein
MSVDDQGLSHRRGFRARIHRLRKRFTNRSRGWTRAVVAGAIGTVLVSVVLWLWNDPTFEPYVAVVMSTQSIDFTIPSEFLRGFQDGAGGKNYLDTRDGLRRVGIQIFEDYGSTEEAARIAGELLNDRNCILVIGNSNSTVTATTLDVFLTSEDAPAYILPIATANNLISKARTGGHKAVLRMVPDNAIQAREVQRLIAHLATESPPRIAIYGDQENPRYSEDLSRDIASRVRERGGRILIEEMLGPSNSIYNSLHVWQGESPPDVIVYVGVAHHGLLLIDQLRELGIQQPIIFTDGCMVNPLIENISRIRNRAFVLSPVGNRAEGKFPTYEPIGRDAHTLASRLLSSCKGCDREDIRILIEDRDDALIVTSGQAGEYRFDSDGNNRAMTYQIYEITGGVLKIVRDF